MQTVLKLGVWFGVAVVIWMIAALSLQAGALGLILGGFVIAVGLKRGLSRDETSPHPVELVGGQSA